MDVKVLLVEKSWPLENFLDHGKTLARGKLVNQGKIWALWKIYWSKKNLFLWKNLGLWKTSSKDKSFLVVKSWLVESFLEQGKMLVTATGFETTTTYFENQDSTIYPNWPDWLVGNSLDPEKIFLCKNLRLWKTSLIQEESWFARNFLNQEKILTCGNVLWSWKNNRFKSFETELI